MPDSKRDFASLLDDLFAAADEQEAAPAVAGIDFLSVVNELHSGRIQVSAAPALASYGETAETLERELAALFVAEAEIAEVLPAIEPEVIAAELRLEGRSPAELAQIRRQFARSNHPDRVEPQLRERALLRMQVANMLIDEAERKAESGRG